MAKQLMVNLVFNANTQQAKAQMQQLQASLQQVQNAFNQQISMSGMTTELSKAQNAVVSLKTSLNSAFDVNTGKLDLNKFNNSLQSGKMSLKDYRIALQQLGPEGQKAFNQLTQSIINGQMPLQKTNGLLNSMMTTFANTTKWMIASKAINAITSGFQEAFSYAKNLNESLTNIRVVTGKTADQMDRFAEKANKAAKALATSTTAYTDAALIYYQQGLDGKAVEERAETTLKLANVTGQSAEEISQQLTAVWNNFYDGSKSIEYYADVMTALGAATASSSDEIAQGLEKFAAVAETVGLSYEYATSALATVTAQTRQSADVVGTAFKTLFARIQDLELGKTLDDGTTLGSYSEALSKVGVNIKNTDGSMKSMNETLDEMGAKWNTLGQDQQVALAKSVAGIRQYTQLIALMENYDDFKINVDIAENATGTLEEQQKIWAESWEAASKRVKAASEDVYKSLINDEFFIDLNNILADLLSGFDDFIEAIGGLKTLIPLVGGLILKAFGPAAITAIQNYAGSIMGASKAQQAQAAGLREQALKQSNIMAGDTDTPTGYAQQASSQAQLDLYKEVESIQHRLNNKQVEGIQTILDANKQWQDIVLQTAQVLENIDQQNNKLREQAQLAKGEVKTQKQDFLSEISKDQDRKNMSSVMQRAETRMGAATNAQMELEDFLQKDANRPQQSANKLLNAIDNKDLGATGKQSIGKDNYKTLQDLAAGKGTGKNGSVTAEDMKKLQDALGKVDIRSTQLTKTTKSLESATNKYGKGVKNAHSKIGSYIKSLDQANPKLQSTRRAQKNLTQSTSQLSQKTKEAIQELQAYKKMPFGQSMIQMASAMGQAAAGASMLTSGIESIKEMFTSGEQSFKGWLSALTSIGFAIPMLTSGLKAMGTAMGFLTTYTSLNSAVSLVNNEIQEKNLKLSASQKAAKMAEALATALNIEGKVAENLVDEQGNIKKGKAIALSVAMKAAKLLEAMGIGTNTAAMIADTVATGSAAAANWAFIWPFGLLSIAIAGLALIIW